MLGDNNNSPKEFGSSLPTGQMPKKVVIHHLGKAGEGLLSLPMAIILKTVYPEAHIEWVVLDRYKAFIGENHFIDSIREVNSSAAGSLQDIGDIFIDYHKKTIPYKPVTQESSTWHCNAYCNYIVKTDDDGTQTFQKIPFYKQFFQNLPFDNHDWFAPNWTARQRDIDDGERFLASCGIPDHQMVIVVSPFVSDKTIPLSERKASEIDWSLVVEKLSTLNLPIIVTGTEFDDQFVPPGCLNGYGPKLSLGGLLYILQTRTYLTVCGNTGIGFAALFLKSNLLMYDNRKTWTEHTHSYESENLHSEGDFWPMFELANMKDDMVDWESNGIQRRFDRDEVEMDVSRFQREVTPEMEVMSHKQYPDHIYSFANKLLQTRGHKYQNAPDVLPTCRITVLVSLYKARDYVWSRLPNLLEQTEKDIEVIVIDANSPQNDGQIVWENFGSDERVTVIRLNQRVPLYVAWNIGIAFSRGKYVTNANADDLLDPTALKTIANWLDNNPEFHLAAGSWYEVKGNYNRWPSPQSALVSENKAPGHFPVWRRDLHSEIGLFDDGYKVVGDIEWWQRLLFNNKKIAKSMQPIGSYLDHGSNLFHAEKTRRLQEIKMSGWPLYHKQLYKTSRYVTFPQSSLPGTALNWPKEGDDLTAFRNKHLGERCFVMGNGPSLNKMDLSKLEGEVVFGSNACHLLFNRISWRPKYYSCVDSRVLPDISEDIKRMHEHNPDMVLFLPSRLHIHDGTGTIKDTQQYIPANVNRFYFNHVRQSEDNLPWSAFSLDIDNHVVMPHTVTITLLQLAMYMGFKEIYLIGCDTSYKVPTTVIQEGPEYRDYGKLFFTSTEDDDPNHFDPRYFGAGKKWHNPKVGEMIKHYEWAKRVINSCGGKVYNSTVGGDLEVFPRVEFDDLFKPVEVVSKSSTTEAKLPRLLLFDITRRGDGTATGEIKATLFADWPEDRLVQFYSMGRDQVGVDGSVPRVLYKDRALRAEEISRVARWFRPDLILYRPVPDNLVLHEAAMSVIRTSELPLAVWLMDDWPTRLAADDPKLFARLDSDLRELLARADLRLSICDAMSAAFAERYKVSFKAFANAINPEDWPLRERDNGQARPFLLRYAGSLARNMTLDSVLRTARAVERIASNGVDIRFEISARPIWREIAEPELKTLKRTSFTTAELTPKAYRHWLSQADALLIAYNFDEASKNYVRYSMANKLPECLASGATLIAHGPSDVATIGYISSLDCALVVSDDDEEALATALKRLVEHPDWRRDLSERGRAVAFSAHNVHEIPSALRAEFLAIATLRSASNGQATLPEYERAAHAHLDETQVISVLFGESAGTERTMIDVGAHIGGSASHFVDKGWQIYCFEPDPANRERLTVSLGNKPNVTIDARAISEKAEVRKPFFSSPESTGISTLRPFHSTHEQTAFVDVTTISDIVEQQRLNRIDFLKIDTEGWDFQVLRSVPWDRLRPAVIECEFEDAKTEPLGYSYHEMADFLLEKGYAVYVSEWHPIVRYGVQHDWCRLFKYPQPLRTRQGWGNLLAFLEDPGADALAAVLEVCVQFPKTVGSGETSPNGSIGPQVKEMGPLTLSPQSVAAKNNNRSRPWAGYEHPLRLITLLCVAIMLAAAPAYSPMWHYRFWFWSAATVLSLWALVVIGVAQIRKAVLRWLELQRVQTETWLNELGGRMATLESRLAALDKNYCYWQTVMRIRETATAALPHDATVLVISKGDDQLLDLNGLRTWHFPQTEDGSYAGHYPADSAEAITHLEVLRAKGANFLLVPDTALWWFEHYHGFKQHLDSLYQRVAMPNCCVVYRLTPVSVNGRSKAKVKVSLKPSKAPKKDKARIARKSPARNGLSSGRRPKSLG